MPEEKPPTYKMVEAPTGNKRAYANMIRAAQTAFDVRLTFGEIVNVEESAEEVAITEEDRITVTVSWLMLKRIAGYLQMLVQNYERHNGELRNPDLTAPGSEEEPRKDGGLPPLVN
jgi:hypothetical protein